MKRYLPLLLLAALPAAAQDISGAMVGHEFRQDDLPSLAAAPDGSIWVAWLSFEGSRDDVVLRRYHNGAWGNMQWVPNTSGDSWLPQVGVDAQNRPWVVWSQQEKGNWDIYARRFDPDKQEWGPQERLTTDPLPDINPRLASDGKGRLVVAWQGFRRRAGTPAGTPAAYSNIFLKSLEGGNWMSSETRVTNRAANDWEPAVAFDNSGAIWVAYDSYKNGNYDVLLSKVSGATVNQEVAVASTPRFETRATIAVDTANRIWVAWEEGGVNWGKDQGYIIRTRGTGVPLGGVRRPQIRCMANGLFRDPAALLADVFKGGPNTYQPHVFSDGKGSVWVAAKTRHAGRAEAGGAAARGYWQYHLTHYDGTNWSSARTLANSRGRSSTRIGGALDKDGALWLAWDTDNRPDRFLHRPLRQQVYAGKVGSTNASTPSLREVAAENQEMPKMAHADEPGDLKAIRTYSVTIDGKKNNIVRGDFHRHTELSWDGGGAADGSLQDFYRYMIDAGQMDFGASTDHQGGAWPYWWWYTQKMTDMYHVPGHYLPIFGYERSAIFPNGHRNMFFAKRSESRVTPFFLREGVEPFRLGFSPMGDEPGIGSGDLVANDTKLLYEEIRDRNGIAISHTSGTRMGTDWRDNDPDLEPVVEIFQGARTNYEKLGAPHVVIKGTDDEHMARAGYQPEGMVNNAWAKGYKLGIITSSDHGSTHISFAMVYTPDISRQGVLDGIRKRHTYGATDNIIMDVRMGNYFMGDEFALKKALPIHVKARGTRNVAKVEVIKDSEVIYTTEPKSPNVDFQFVDKGDVAGRHFYYIRLQQDDEMIAWSSPFFINYK